MNKLTNPTEQELTEFLSAYKFYINENNKEHLVTVFFGIFFYAMARSYADNWQFWIEEDRLHCENDSKFKYVYPLKK